MTTSLYPPREIIRAGLFDAERPAESADLDSHGAELGIANDQDVLSAKLPPLIADLIRRRVAADQLPSSKPPAVGQIRSISRVPAPEGGQPRPLDRTVGILLGASLAERAGVAGWSRRKSTTRPIATW